MCDHEFLWGSIVALLCVMFSIVPTLWIQSKTKSTMLAIVWVLFALLVETVAVSAILNYEMEHSWQCVDQSHDD